MTVVFIQLGFVLATSAAITLFFIDLDTWRRESAAHGRARKAGLRAFVRGLGALGTALGSVALSVYVQSGVAGWWPSIAIGVVLVLGFVAYYTSYLRIRAGT